MNTNLWWLYECLWFGIRLVVQLRHTSLHHTHCVWCVLYMHRISWWVSPALMSSMRVSVSLNAYYRAEDITQLCSWGIAHCIQLDFVYTVSTDIYQNHPKYIQRWAVRFESQLIRCSGLSFSKRTSESEYPPEMEADKRKQTTEKWKIGSKRISG